MVRPLQNFSMVYDDAGSGAPVLFIHGYPLNRRMWKPQIEGLSGRFRVIAPDLRGFGESEATPGPIIMDTFADDCAALLDTLNIPRAVIGGLSMGGYVAFAFWRRHPQRVSRMILAATRALPDSPEAAENRLKAAALAEKEGAEAIARLMLPKMLSTVAQNEQPELAEGVRAILRQASVMGITGALMGMRLRPDSTPSLPTITVPTLIIRGDEDAFVPLEEAEHMQMAIPNARLARISRAGHLPNLEQPTLFNQAVQSFLDAEM